MSLQITQTTLQTTAHTLCYALAMLALNPETQDTLYEETKKVIADGRTPVRDP